MKRKLNCMGIEKFLKDGKDVVIELNDQVEYVLNKKATMALRNGEKQITLLRLYDGKDFPVDVEEIKKAILGGGIVDYLDEK